MPDSIVDLKQAAILIPDHHFPIEEVALIVFIFELVGSGPAGHFHGTFDSHTIRSTARVEGSDPAFVKKGKWKGIHIRYPYIDPAGIGIIVPEGALVLAGTIVDMRTGTEVHCKGIGAGGTIIICLFCLRIKIISTFDLTSLSGTGAEREIKQHWQDNGCQKEKSFHQFWIVRCSKILKFIQGLSNAVPRHESHELHEFAAAHY